MSKSIDEPIADEDYLILERITKVLWEKHIGLVNLESGYRVISAEQYNKDIAQEVQQARIDELNSTFEFWHTYGGGGVGHFIKERLKELKDES